MFIDKRAEKVVENFFKRLSGNSIKNEVSPDDSKDENVFNIRVGVAIFIGIKTTKKEPIIWKAYNQFFKQFDNEYIEISTCNRKEYYIHNDHINFEDELLSHDNQSIIIVTHYVR